MKLEGSRKYVAGASGCERERTRGELEFLGAGGNANMGANARAETLSPVSRPKGAAQNGGGDKFGKENWIELKKCFPFGFRMPQWHHWKKNKYKHRLEITSLHGKHFPLE